MSDLTDLPVITERALALSTEEMAFHKGLLDSLYDGVYFVDLERRITYWNRGAEQLTGYSREEALGRQCFHNFLMHVNDQGSNLCFGGCPLGATLRDGERRQAEVYLRHKLGHRVPVSVRVAPIQDTSGCVIGAVEVFSDISALKRIERRAGELETLAYHDPLTGIPNRRYVELKVQQALEEVTQFGRNFALLLIDLDRFKSVNDSRGHEAGDLVLRTICNTLSMNLRPGDTLARWGGEEFLLLAADCCDAVLNNIAARCCNLIAGTAVPVGIEHLHVTASLGATALKAGEGTDEAIRRADRLMYRSKTEGRNRYTIG